MGLNRTLIAITKERIRSLEAQQTRLHSALYQTSDKDMRKCMQERIATLEKEISKARTALEDYYTNGTSYEYLKKFTGCTDEDLKKSSNNTKAVPQYQENEIKTEDLIWGAILVVIVIGILYICWKIIEFFSDTPYGTDYENGIMMFIALIFVILYCWPVKR